MDRKLGPSIFAALAAVAVGSTTYADVTPLTDNDGTSDFAHYTTMHDANISVLYSSNDAGNQHGTITISTTWEGNDYSPRQIFFSQDAPPPNNAGNAAYGESRGGRWQLELSMVNNSDLPWVGFKVSTEDTSVPAGAENHFDGRTFHLFESHFHPNDGGPTVNAGGLTTFNNLNNKQEAFVSGGVHNAGAGALILTNFFMHERNLRGENPDGSIGDAVARQFVLVLTPIPEPSTLVLLALGAMPLVLRAVRRTRR